MNLVAAWSRAVLGFGHWVRGPGELRVLERQARGGVVVFTHLQDVDATGRDRQMGPLIDALLARGERVAEICLLPLAFGRRRRRQATPRPCLSYAALLAAARLRTWPGSGRARLLAARTRVANAVLRRLAPKAVFLIDESGSGQPFVRAARSLGIRTIGVQHGDVGAAQPAYAPQPGRSFDVVPADVLALWGEAWRERLLAVSPVYEEATTAVVGRLRYPRPPLVPATPGLVRVLVLGDADGRSAEALAAVLRARKGVRVGLRPHPAAGTPAPESDRRPLDLALADSDVVAGYRSTALLEAVLSGVPAVTVDPVGPPFVDDGAVRRGPTTLPDAVDFILGAGLSPLRPEERGFAPRLDAGTRIGSWAVAEKLLSLAGL